jgi:hypothetical protein
VLAARWARKTISLTSAALGGALSLAVGAGMWLPWAVRNLMVYGDATAESVANVPVHWASPVQAAQASFTYMKESFWAVSGIYNNVRFFPIVGAHVFYAAIVGLVYGVLVRDETFHKYLHGKNSSLLIGMAFAIAVNVVLVMRFGMLYAQAQGRFLFPMLIPISVLLAMGIRWLAVGRSSTLGHIHVVGFFVTYVLSFTGFSIGMFKGA